MNEDGTWLNIWEYKKGKLYQLVCTDQAFVFFPCAKSPDIASLMDAMAIISKEEMRKVIFIYLETLPGVAGGYHRVVWKDMVGFISEGVGLKEVTHG